MRNSTPFVCRYRCVYFTLVTSLFLLPACRQSSNAQVAVPKNPVVKIEGIASLPVHTSIDYFTFSDSGSSEISIGSRVFHVGPEGIIEIDDAADGKEDGFRVFACNPTSRKLAIVLYDGKKEIARKESTKRGETFHLDVGRCKKLEKVPDLSDFSTNDQDQSRIARLEKFFKTADVPQLNHHRGSVPGLAGGIAAYLKRAYGKQQANTPIDWIRVDFGDDVGHELKGVAEFEKGTLVVGVKVDTDGKEMLRVVAKQPVFEEYRQSEMENAMREYTLELSKASFNEEPVYPLESDGGKFDRANRERYGGKLSKVVIGRIKWTPATESKQIGLLVEAKITTEKSEYYLLHEFELDKRRLSSAAILTKRSASDTSILDSK